MRLRQALKVMWMQVRSRQLFSRGRRPRHRKSTIARAYFVVERARKRVAPESVSVRVPDLFGRTTHTLRGERAVEARQVLRPHLVSTRP